MILIRLIFINQTQSDHGEPHYYTTDSACLVLTAPEKMPMKLFTFGGDRLPISLSDRLLMSGFINHDHAWSIPPGVDDLIGEWDWLMINKKLNNNEWRIRIKKDNLPIQDNNNMYIPPLPLATKLSVPRQINGYDMILWALTLNHLQRWTAETLRRAVFTSVRSTTLLDEDWFEYSQRSSWKTITINSWWKGYTDWKTILKVYVLMSFIYPQIDALKLPREKKATFLTYHGRPYSR